ncbi:helix-turn-helix domain-containing protein [Frisingicoccus sp.]|uniref:helix-turn-helix domain-containing protein n=1 Tax=Frisingicoccus sp. TaxID=1918627 RepID=UPI002EA7EC14|nr:helix-turn-helix domain-containing protein [Frisingicoccus sp.]
MHYNVKEIRESTGMSQKAFATLYGIPLSTLRNWEQGINSPAPYIVNLLARTLPSMNSTLKEIRGKKGHSYYYDKNQNCVLDINGNRIYIKEELEGIKEQNLVLYLDDLFESFYEIQEKFNRDCEYDKEEDILWV